MIKYNDGNSREKDSREKYRQSSQCENKTISLVKENK